VVNQSPAIRGFFNFNDQLGVPLLKALLPASSTPRSYLSTRICPCRIPIFPNFHFPLDSIFTDTILPAYSLPILDLGFLGFLVCGFDPDLGLSFGATRLLRECPSQISLGLENWFIG
jgi:hypothetical protein